MLRTTNEIATTTVAGVSLRASDADTITGTSTTETVSPANLTAKIDTDGALTNNLDTRIASQKATKTYADLKLAKASNLSDVGNAATAFRNIRLPASTTEVGAVELATSVEVVTGIDTDRAVTPSGLTARLAAPGSIGGTTPATAVTTQTLRVTTGAGTGKILVSSDNNGNMAFTTLGTMGQRSLTVSTSAPSGGSDGDVWFRYST